MHTFECATAERVHELIKHGASVDACKANGSTPLIIHSSAGNTEVVQVLIKEKANVDWQSLTPTMHPLSSCTSSRPHRCCTIINLCWSNPRSQKQRNRIYWIFLVLYGIIILLLSGMCFCQLLVYRARPFLVLIINSPRTYNTSVRKGLA